MFGSNFPLIVFIDPEEGFYAFIRQAWTLMMLNKSVFVGTGMPVRTSMLVPTVCAVAKLQVVEI